MLIRTQKDNTLVNVNAMDYIAIAKYNSIVACKGDDIEIWLGSYPSETRAIEVMNQIGNAYGKESLFVMPEPRFEFD